MSYKLLRLKRVELTCWPNDWYKNRVGFNMRYWLGPKYEVSIRIAHTTNTYKINKTIQQFRTINLAGYLNNMGA